MKLSQLRELHKLLASQISDSDPEQDAATTQAYAASLPHERRLELLAQARQLSASELPLDELGSEANRWFATEDEARTWFETLCRTLEQSASENTQSSATAPKDSNGALLAEGDSVTVIKDLKVRGGSSDLKRGTLIKKIHLVDDPEVVECRVDGSTLVLKTCFLKKA